MIRKYFNRESCNNQGTSSNYPVWTLIFQILGFLGPFIIAVVGSIFGYLIHKEQQRLESQLINQEYKLTASIEGVRNNILENQLSVQKASFASTLVERLLTGKESERLLAMELLNYVDDSLAFVVSKALVLNDASVNIRMKAITKLENTGGTVAIEALSEVVLKGETIEERQKAQNTITTLKHNTYQESLKFAEILLNMGRWHEAADNYMLARKHADPEKLDDTNIALSISHYERQEFRESAEAFSKAFITN